MLVAIIQARLGSTRFPEKILKEINGISVIHLLLERLKKSKYINNIIMAIPNDFRNNKLEKHIRKIENIKVFRGDEFNVLQRYYMAVRSYKNCNILRITGDCPLIDPYIVDEMYEIFESKKIDYISNTIKPTFPDGLDVELFNKRTLDFTYKNVRLKFDKEHVTPFMKRSKKIVRSDFFYKKDLSSYRITIDEQEDLKNIKKICDYFYPNIYFSLEDILKNLKDIKKYMINKNKFRNEGSVINTGQKLWKRAKKVIPGGNMLFSKRPEMYLPNGWPAYYSKTQGCNIWDLENRKYVDLSSMSVGTNILGYCNKEINKEIKKVISLGNISTLNCPEEVYLAEKMVKLHDWSDMVRFARTGGEANSISIRISRAYTKKNGIAVCGYHGWHDWYLASYRKKTKFNNANLRSEGVPKILSNYIHTFQYNDVESLEKILKEKEIGIIKMEVMRNQKPEKNFLNDVKKLSKKYNAVLIFDECTSGFREVLGGLHKKYLIEPDLAIFGKALGNGYPITCVIGKKNIMQAVQDTFVSSTFWTERIGPVAALKTLEIMERDKTWLYISNLGLKIEKEWKKLAAKHKLKVVINGLEPMKKFEIVSPQWMAYKTFITQEMLKKGFLAGSTIFVCINHNLDILSNYFKVLDVIFSKIALCENGKNINDLLEYPICHSDFKRLN